MIERIRKVRQEGLGRSVLVAASAVALATMAGWIGCDTGLFAPASAATSETVSGTASDPVMEWLVGLDWVCRSSGTSVSEMSVHCDKVTTYVCPDGTCLCKQHNCSNVQHDRDYAPCNGPPVAGCEHDFAQQVCFPVGQPINCSEQGVPVNHCVWPCVDDVLTYTTEPNGCCRGERKCKPGKILQPTQP